MKNQYFGDIGDYKKYSILRAFALQGALRVAVCWMLTEDDSRSDGQKIQYLSQQDKWRHYDPHVFDLLHRLVIVECQRSITHVEQHELIPHAVFLSDILVDDRLERERFFNKLTLLSSAADMVFFDPDNGLETASTKYGTRNSSKYLYWNELVSTYAKGVSVLVYQHYIRESHDQFVARLAASLLNRTAAPEVIAIRPRKTPSMYFLIPQATHRNSIEQCVSSLSNQWDGELQINTYTQSHSRIE